MQLWALRQTIVDTMGEIVAGNERGSKILHSAGFVVPRIIALLANEIEYFYSRPEDALQRSLPVPHFAPVPSVSPLVLEADIRVASPFQNRASGYSTP